MKRRLARKVARVRFTPVRIREGYAMDEVDSLLERVEDALLEGRPVAPLIAGAKLTTVHTREGYEKHEVDEFLAKVSERDATTPSDDGAYAGDPEVVAQISAADFEQALFRKRYDMDAVEHLVDELLETAMQGGSLSGYLNGAQLPLAGRFQPGYPVPDVDRFLASLREERSPA